MYIFFISMMITIAITLGLVTKGLVERGLWIISAAILGALYNGLKRKGLAVYLKSYRKVVRGIILGYILVLLLLIYIQYPLKEAYVGVNYVDTNEAAIILVFKGEPDAYDLSLSIRNYRTNNNLWRTVLMPFNMFIEKLNYEKTDFIKEKYYTIGLEQNLKEEFGEEYNIYSTYLFNKPYLSEIIFKAVADGNQKIILCPIFMAENNEFNLIENTIKKMNLHEHQVEIHRIEPMWNSDIIARSFVNQVDSFKESQHKHNIGIVLIGEELEKRDYNKPFIKQDLLFREKIKDYLIRSGYNNNKIRLTFFDKRNIHKEIEELMEYGVGEILLIPSTNTLQSSHYQLKIERLIKGMDAPYTVKIHAVDPWSFNHDIGRELVNRIRLLNL
ncbi:hypothetical protein SAMN05446037_1006209 [Anaerovirgula multivorans]|uniref:Ferrochelatase n=1 Tax=Anaerovirgula multivorans TaxID=312168 RepID=A0A239CXE6_9FIRM|nr:hypothetical protein [Anaerovirgula multivorans]SNS24727.1 hypothetical protein SAMN05446037_1006209 [Anaerovirgula multivorans]